MNNVCRLLVGTYIIHYDLFNYLYQRYKKIKLNNINNNSNVYLQK